MLDESPAYVKAIAPYRPGKPIEEVAREYGLDAERIVKLASNENPLGMPPSARAAIQAALEDLGRYPDSNCFDLKAAIAARHGLPETWITLGNGSRIELGSETMVMLDEKLTDKKKEKRDIVIVHRSTQAAQRLPSTWPSGTGSPQRSASRRWPSRVASC